MIFDLVIVGMGSGGMVAAELATSLGLKVAVVERGRVGGDCLWTGCVPSKALLASAKVAHHLRTADRFGLPPMVDPDIDTALVWKRLRAIQEEIAATDDNPERYRAMGVDLIHGNARITGPHEVLVDGTRRVRAAFILVCTGSRPAAPDLPGLAEAGFLTSENLFEIERAPKSLIVIGGGPISIEISQAMRRLGVQVAVLQRGATVLPRDEPSLVARLMRVIAEEGVDLCLDVVTERVEVEPGGLKVVHGTRGGAPATWAAEELLVAVGRRPNVEGLGLDEIGVRTNARGIEVDDRMRSSVPSIYAAGDVAGRNLFTHAAGYEAVRAVRDMFFPGKGTAGAAISWATFTDPELAHAGLTEAEAVEAHGREAVQAWRLELAHSDRARAEGAAAGEIVLVTARRTLVGAHVLAPAAGEVIHELALAIERGLRLSELAGLVHVYPTLSTSIGQLAAEAAFGAAGRYGWVARTTAGIARWKARRGA